MSNRHNKDTKRTKRVLNPFKNRDLRPTAEDLSTHPSLRNQLAKIENQPHPLDTTCFLNKILISYVNPYLNLAKKVIVTQRCHHRLPKSEELFKTRDDIGLQLYNHGKESRARAWRRNPSLPDKDSGACFEMKPTLQTPMMKAILRAYSFQFFYIIFLLLFSSLINFVSVFAMKNGLDEITTQLSTSGALTDKETILFWFLVVWGISVSDSVIQGWVGVEQSRVVVRICGGMHGILFEKFLRIGVINPHEHDEGSIISYLQTDVMRLYMSMFGLSQFVTNVSNLLLSIAIGIIFFGWSFLVILVGLYVLGYANKKVLNKYFEHYMLYAGMKDKRLNLFKNVLKNISFVKIAAIENVFYQRIDQIRSDEVGHNVKVTFYNCLMDQIMTVGTALIIISFLILYFLLGKKFDVSTITILLRVFELLKDSLFGVPAGIGVLSSLRVNFSRLSCFLESKELDSGRVRLGADSGSRYGVEIKNGCFYWDKKMSKEEAEAIKKTKMEAAKKSKKKAKDQQGDDAQGYELKETLLTGDYQQSQARQGRIAEIGDGRFVLDKVNFRAEKGKLTMVIGKIGSGKSSLLYSILGETRIGDFERTQVQINGSVCFMGQNPWLVSGTVRDNILLDKEFDRERFDWAIKYSALDHDLRIWDLGEEHLIGESGSALSGGQRARVVLARCLYQDPEIYIFDDIMSALDGKIGAFIYEQTILKQLKDKTVILVTHGLQYLKFADYIYVMDEGEIKQEGGFEDIRRTELYQKFQEIEQWSKKTQKEAEEAIEKDIIDSIENILDPETTKTPQKLAKTQNDQKSKDHQKSNSKQEKAQSTTTRDTSAGEITSLLVEHFTSTQEDRSVGSISCSTLTTFTKGLGGFTMILLLILSSFASYAITMVSNKYLEDWSKHFSPETSFKHLTVYSLIWLGVAATQVLGQYLRIRCSYNMSTVIHSKMTFSLLHSKLQQFLNKVPYGQIQNRFSQDMATVDTRSVNCFYWFMDPLTNCFVNFFTLCYAVGWQISLFIVVWLVLVFRLERRYMNAKREYNRLKAMSSSPVITTTSDVIKGLAVIRAMNLRQFFREQFLGRVTVQMQNDLLDKIMTNWFSMRSNLSQLVFIQLFAIIGLLYVLHEMEPANVGLFFVCLFSLGPKLYQMLTQKTQWETSLVTVERCEFFTKLEPEEGYRSYEEESKKYSEGGNRRMKRLLEREKLRFEQEDNPQKFDQKERILPNIVSRGRVEFKGVTARYYSTASDVLKNLDFSIKAGEKVGVLGRSGSGKSSLIRLLWGYLRPRGGQILVDGHSVTEIDIKSLRAQISVITQETSLFEGTLRQNLDPTTFRFGDARLEAVLAELDFQNKDYKEKGLDMPLDSQGTNLSQGEKQLLCFARAVLSKSKLVLLDEATASIDLKTEETIQRVIRDKFEGRTMIIVAHRVQTVLDCDRILVMKDGRVDSFDSPSRLMNENEFFQEIVEKMREG